MAKKDEKLNDDVEEQEEDVVESAAMEEPPEDAIEEEEEEIAEEGVQEGDLPGVLSTSQEGLSAQEEDVLAVHAEIEAKLQQIDQPEDIADEESMGVRGADFYETPNNILGVGIASVESSEGDLEFEGPSVTLYTVEPTTEDQALGVLSDLGVQGAGSDAPVRIIAVGEEFEADSYRGRYRPAPGGSSVGHYRITAGTLGCLARACRKTGSCYNPGDRRCRVLILSNNHVLANSNNARCLDPILQPGRHDGGRNPRDRIALLEKWVPIRFGSGRVNYTDCATGWAWHQRVDRRIWWGRSRIRISSQPIWSTRGMVVCKSGRTTQSRRGRIIDNSWSGWVNYGGGRRAFFRRQFVVRGIGRGFSAPGDSGSLVWRCSARRPTGLLFAGGGGLTICNRIQYVLSRNWYGLDIRLWT